MFKVIVAEDNQELQEFLKEMIELIDHEIELATAVDNNEDLLKVLADNPYSLVISDLYLRGHQSVFEGALKDLPNKEQYKFIFMTGFSDDNIYRQCLEYNPVAFLNKPFSMHSLAFALGKAAQAQYEKAFYLDEFSKYLHENDMSSKDLSYIEGGDNTSIDKLTLILKGIQNLKNED